MQDGPQTGFSIGSWYLRMPVQAASGDVDEHITV